MNIYIDIETTFAAHWTPGQIQAFIRDSVPGNYSKQDTIDNWVAQNGRKVYEKTACDYKSGWVTCAGLLVGEGEPVLFDGVSPSDVRVEALDAAQRDMLAALLGELCRCRDVALDAPGGLWAPRIVTWNGNEFDLPWLIRLAYRYRLPELAKQLAVDLEHRPARWLDLQRAWGFGERFTKQRECLEFLRIKEEHPDLSGRDMPALWEEGRQSVVREHLRSDLLALREIARAMGVA